MYRSGGVGKPKTTVIIGNAAQITALTIARETGQPEIEKRPSIRRHRLAGEPEGESGPRKRHDGPTRNDDDYEAVPEQCQCCLPGDEREEELDGSKQSVGTSEHRERETTHDKGTAPWKPLLAIDRNRDRSVPYTGDSERPQRGRIDGWHHRFFIEIVDTG
jgi:hypothetical protein